MYFNHRMKAQWLNVKTWVDNYYSIFSFNRPLVNFFENANVRACFHNF